MYVFGADVVRYLVSVCGDEDVVSLPTASGRTCLHIAAMTNDVRLLRCLLDLNANCNVTLRFEVHIIDALSFTHQPV